MVFRNPILGFLIKWPINFSFIFSNVYFSNLEALSCDVKIGNLPLVILQPTWKAPRHFFVIMASH